MVHASSVYVLGVQDIDAVSTRKAAKWVGINAAPGKGAKSVETDAVPPRRGAKLVAVGVSPRAAGSERSILFQPEGGEAALRLKEEVSASSPPAAHAAGY